MHASWDYIPLNWIALAPAVKPYPDRVSVPTQKNGDFGAISVTA